MASADTLNSQPPPLQQSAMNATRDAVAQRLAQAHYAVEPGIRAIVQLEAGASREGDSKEPIKLLEVNDNTTAIGIHPIFFGAHPDSGILYPSVIVEVTSAEYEQIRRQPSMLPNGWRLGRELARVAPAKAV